MMEELESISVDEEKIERIINRVLSYVCERKLAVNDGAIVRKFIAAICEEKDKSEIQEN